MTDNPEVAVNLPGLNHTLYGIELERHGNQVTVKVFNGRDMRFNTERTITVDAACVRPWHGR